MLPVILINMKTSTSGKHISDDMFTYSGTHWFVHLCLITIRYNDQRAFSEQQFYCHSIDPN